MTIKVKNILMMDSFQKTLVVGLEWCGLLGCFFQLFGHFYFGWTILSKSYSYSSFNVTKDLIGLKKQGGFISNWLLGREGITNEGLLMSAEKESHFRCIMHLADAFYPKRLTVHSGYTCIVSNVSEQGKLFWQKNTKRPISSILFLLE